MKIGKDKVVSIHYTLTGQDGGILDSSPEGAPLSFIQGSGQIIPGLERALEGKGTGDHLAVTLPPEEAYGPRSQELVRALPRSLFADLEAIEVGGQFIADTGQGEMLLTIAAIGEETVTVDGNHPLAGATLHFTVDVAEVRDATGEEIKQGNPRLHDPCGGGCSCG